MAAPVQVLIGGVDVTAQLEDGATFSNVDPGGYEAAMFSFQRDPGVKRGQAVLVAGGLETAWAGRVQRVSRRLAGQTGVTVACEGYGARLKETLVTEVWIDLDLSHWQGPGLTRLIALAAQAQGSVEATPGPDGVAALKVSHTGGWSVGLTMDAIYIAPSGVEIERVYSNWQGTPGNINPADANWQVAAFATTDGNDFNDSSGDFYSAQSGNLIYEPATPRQGVILQVKYTAGPAGGDGAEYNFFWGDLAVYGNRGLTRRPLTAADGFYPSDLARDVLSRVSGIAEGVIEEASHFIVPHAVAYTPTEAERLQADWAMLAGGWHWGTWAAPGSLGGGPVFDFRALPETASCHIARADLDGLELEEDLSRLFDRAEVTYTDGAATQRTVTVERDLPELADTEVGHRTLPADLGEGSLEAAEAYGLLLLALAERAGRASGSATTKAPVKLPGGGEKDAYLLRSGIDKLKVSDLPGLPLLCGCRDEFQLKRVEGSIAKDGVTTTLELGLGADLQEVLAARLALNVGVATFGR